MAELLSQALTTLARQKVFMGISSDSHDTLLTQLINQTTGFIERFTKRNLLSQTYTNKELDGVDGDTIVLPNFPVTALSSFQYRTSDDNSDNWESFNSTDEFRWFADGRVQLIGAKFREVPKKYRATFVAGYLIDFSDENNTAVHTLPPELEYVCQKLVAALFNTRKAEGFERTDLGDMGVVLKKGIFSDPETKAILDKYAAPTI